MIGLGGGGEGQEHGDERVTVDGRLTPEGLKQCLTLECIDHLARIDLGDRDQPDDDIGDDFGEDPADTEHDRGSELRIIDHSGDEFAGGTDHRSDEDLHLAVGRCRCGEQCCGRLFGIGRRPQAEPDETSFGLMSDRIATELGDDGTTETRRCSRCTRWVVDQLLLEERHAVPGEEQLGLRLGESGAGDHAMSAARKKERRWSSRSSSAPGSSGSRSRRPSMNGRSEK